MDYAFILDPLPDLKAYKDSSVAMMRSLAARGHAKPGRLHATASAGRPRSLPAHPDARAPAAKVVRRQRML